ncbi:radical SAM protein [candidate division CSSED10-310 bacterium]|uniref:Radical SAM protein n=1 Tax=candidate division CSSED10-310 bacterium TaxID=2855610 RepID=A0ABV6Z007_UNCC1
MMATKAIMKGARLLARGTPLLFDDIPFYQEKTPYRKRFNYIFQGIQALVRNPVRFGLPPILQLEPVNSCNLHCLTCPTGSKLMTRPAAMMSYDMFCTIIDQVKDDILLVAFWSWGEPFMNPDAFHMIHYAKQKGLLVHTSTNGHFFSSREQASKLVDSGLDSVIIAIDGLDPQTYAVYRGGGQLNRVIQSIEHVVAERAACGVNHPLITLRFIVMKHNEHQQNQVEKFARELNVDYVSFRSPVVQREGINLHKQLAPDTFDFAPERFSKSELSPKSFLCFRPYGNLTIFSNSDVVSCENDYNATIPFGNVAQQSLRQILSSPSCRSFMTKFRKNSDQLSFCRTCELKFIDRPTHNIHTYKLTNQDHNHNAP